MTNPLANIAITIGQRDRLVQQIADGDVAFLRRVIADAQAEIAMLRADAIARCEQIDRLEDENRDQRALIVRLEKTLAHVAPRPASASALLPAEEGRAGGADYSRGDA